ncbi:MAG: response regulator [Candidatus Omnitrophica bacterium]|nr:response regulator [Candidatus Omnitrophota bacterium]
MGNKLNNIRVTVSFLKDIVESKKWLETEVQFKNKLMVNFDVVERAVMEANRQILEIKNIHYRGTNPDQNINDVVLQMISENNKMRILIVDDEENICTILKQNFERNGFETDCVSSGEDAIEKIKSSSPPSIILLDLCLKSDVNGLEVLKFIQSNQRDISCIIFTVEDDPRVGRELLACGASHVLIKPVAVNQINAIVNSIISKFYYGQQHKI